MRRLALALSLAGCAAQPGAPILDARWDVAEEAHAEIAADLPVDAAAIPHDASEVLCDADCEDGNPCTNDLCISGLGCAHIPRAGPCDDGNPCTIKDVCAAAVCGGAPVPGCK